MTVPFDRVGAPDKVRARLLELALGFPGAWADHPWGETVVKVDKKIFLFLGVDRESEHGFGFGVKLRESHEEALGADGITQMGYGLGKSGWVSVSVARAEIPVEVFEDWVEESYRTVALKRRIAELDRRTQDR